MASNSSAEYALLTRLADEFASRYRRGERPSLQEYLDKYPELAEEIREFFPAMDKMEQVEEARLAFRPFELVFLFHGQPGHPPTLGGQRVTGASQLLLLHEELLSSGLPRL